MSGEHEDHETDSPEQKPRVAEAEGSGRSDSESGPRISAHPVADDSSELQDYGDEDDHDHEGDPSLPQRRSGPPPKPRLKDSKYPPPAAADGELPPPRAKVISSPDLPPPRPKTDPPTSPTDGDAERSSGTLPAAPAVAPALAANPSVSVTGGEALGRSAPPSPPLRSRPPGPSSVADVPSPFEARTAMPAPRARMAALIDGISDEYDGSEDDPAATSEATPAGAGFELLPPPLARTASEQVLAAPTAGSPGVPRPASQSGAPSTSRVLAPPPKPERRDEFLARSPSLKPPPLPTATTDRGLTPPAAAAADRGIVLPAQPAATPDVGLTPPAAAAAHRGIVLPVPAVSAEPELTAPPLTAPPLAAPAPAPAAAATAAPELPSPPAAMRPSSSGAATSYPPPSSGPAPEKMDPIAVHAIRVINITGPADAFEPPPAPRNEPLESIDDYAEEEIEPPPDSLDEVEVEALAEDEQLGQLVPTNVDEPTDGAPQPTTEVKLPPPPKRAPAPPKQKGPRAPTRKRKPWWEEVFNEDFTRATHHVSSRHIKREVDFIDHSLGVAQGAIVLDLACGTGEHSIELASRGYNVVGYDLSVYQLAIAGEAAQERELKINFLQGDMREMAFQEMFDGIFCWNTSFGYFEEERNVAVAERIFHALRPGGMFLIDVVNRDHVMQHQPSQVWFQGDACVCMDDMSVDYITSRLRVKRSIIMDDGRTRECFYSIRLYTLHELGKLLHQVGFRVVEASGHPTTPGVYLGPNSPRVIILAQRP